MRIGNNEKKIKTNHLQTGGFTLLEMIVSLGILAVVAVIAVGALVRMTSLNRQAQTLQSAMNSINFTLESISREMRVGTSYYCGVANQFTSGSTLTTVQCPGGFESIGDKTVALMFKSSRTALLGGGGTCNLVFAYWFVPNEGYFRLLKSQQTVCDGEGANIRATSAYPVLDETNIKLTDYKIEVNSGTNKHSFATITLKGYSGKAGREKEINYFDIRTGIEQRLAD